MTAKEKPEQKIEPITLDRLNLAFHSFGVRHGRYDFLAPNIYLEYGTEMDLMGIRKSGYIDEIEIKLSRQDYRADFRKESHVRGVLTHLYTRRPIPCTWPKHEALERGLLVPTG